MPPFHLPWSSFGALLTLAGAVILAVVWALVDRAREGRR